MGNDNELSSEPPDTVGERIRARRLALRITQVKLAEKMHGNGFGWHQETVRRVERGIRHVVAEELPVIAGLLRTEPGDLVPGWKEKEAA